jgi:hypothetical protein
MECVRLLVFRYRKSVASLAALAACMLAGAGCSSSPNPTYPEVSLATACPAAVSPNSRPAVTVRMDQAVSTLSATVGTRIIAISTKRYPIKFTPARLGCLVSSRLGGRFKHRVAEFIVVAPGRARILFVVGTGGPTGQGLNAVRPVSVRIRR